MAYRCFPGSASTGGTGPPPPSGAVTRSPSPPPTMPGRECKFCKNNGETTQMYRSHSLRNPSDGRLICPVLRDHICDLCGATGDGAHTRCALIIWFVEYWDFNQLSNQSITVH